MTDRENLERAVRFDRPERIPMSFHVNASCWHHYPQEELQGLMASHHLLFPGFEASPGPVEVELAPHVRAGEPFTDPWGCVWETADDGIIGAVVRHPLESWDALEGYSPPDPDRSTHWGPIDWEAQKKEMGPSISQSCIPNGEVGHNHTWLRLVDIRGYANALYDMTDGVLEGGSSGSGVFNYGGQLLGQQKGVCCISLSCAGAEIDCDNKGGYVAQYGEFESTYPAILRWLEMGGTIHVDGGYEGQELGTPSEPFNTVVEAYNFAWDGTRIKMAAGSYPESLTFSKQIELLASGGTVTIGE